MSETLVAINIPAGKTPLEAGVDIPRLADWGRATLARAIIYEDLQPVFTFTSAYHFAETPDEGTVEVWRPSITPDKEAKDGYQVRAHPFTVALESLGAIRNTSRRLGHGLPELNRPEVRDTTSDKAATNALLHTVNLAKEWGRFDDLRDIPEAVETITGDAVVFKPRRGKRGSGIILATKADVADLIEDGLLTDGAEMIVEERLDMSLPFPVRGINDEEQAKVDRANMEGRAKELRAYYFGKDRSGNPQLHFVMRMASDKNPDYLHGDDWVIIDQDSVPDEVYEGSMQVAEAFESATGVAEVHLATDWVRAVRNGEAEWIPMEVNGNEPQLVYERDHQLTARQHARLLARQLYRIATAKPAA